jgi:hypothetical protein
VSDTAKAITAGPQMCRQDALHTAPERQVRLTHDSGAGRGSCSRPVQRMCNGVRSTRPRTASIYQSMRRPTPVFRGRLRSAFLLLSLRGWRSQDRGVRVPPSAFHSLPLVQCVRPASVSRRSALRASVFERESPFRTNRPSRRQPQRELPLASPEPEKDVRRTFSEGGRLPLSREAFPRLNATDVKWQQCHLV